MEIIDNDAINYELGAAIEQGGEGGIFEVKNHPELLCKIYDQIYRNQGIYLKIRCQRHMNIPKELRDITTFPLKTVYQKDSQGQPHFVGFLMNKVNDSICLDKCFPIGKQLPWKIRLAIAMNICHIVETIHQNKFIISDFNPKNFLVNTKTCHVVLCDIDSLHFQGNDGRFYKTQAGIPTYYPKEIIDRLQASQGEVGRLKLPSFNRYTDYHSLAVLIFQLLMNGVHPYKPALNKDYYSHYNKELPEVEECIIKGIVPYTLKKDALLTTPSFMPDFQRQFPPHLQQCFNKTFVEGTLSPQQRTSPEEFYQALQEALQATVYKKCSKHGIYHVYTSSQTCPYCQLIKKVKKAHVYQPQTPRFQQSTVNKKSPAISWIQVNINIVKAFIKALFQPLKPYRKRHFFANNVAMILIVIAIAFGGCYLFDRFMNNQETSQIETTYHYILPASENAYYSEDELKTLSKKDLTLGYCEIFAKRGMIFSEQFIKDYFLQQSWYTPITSDIKSMTFNQFEKANIKTIANYIEANGGFYDE